MSIREPGLKIDKLRDVVDIFYLRGGLVRDKAGARRANKQRHHKKEDKEEDVRACLRHLLRLERKEWKKDN